MTTTRARLTAAIYDLAGQGISVHLGLTGSTGVREWDVKHYTDRATRDGFGDRWAGTHVGSDEHGGAEWRRDDMVLRYQHDGSPVQELYFAFNHRVPEIGKALADTFEAHGFEVEWDGTVERSVVVKL
jgi:hypothetical protein